jgi:hypothetical protein
LVLLSKIASFRCPSCRTILNQWQMWGTSPYLSKGWD